MTEKYRADLRFRQALLADIRRLLAAGYLGSTGPMAEDLGREIYLGALDEHLRTSIRNWGPKKLHEAFKIALESEAYTNMG